MAGFGSTVREDVDEGMILAKNIRNKTATIGGLSAEIQIQKQQIITQNQRMNALENWLATLQGQYDQFQVQRGIELSKMVGHGPTVRDS